MKHVAGRWRFEAGTQWLGFWAAGSEPIRYNLGTLWPNGRPRSMISFDAGATRQLAEHFALGVGLAAGQVHDCLDLFCDWTARNAEASLHLVPPLALAHARDLPAIGTRWRPASFTPPSEPDGTPIDLPRTVAWFSVGASAAFYW